MDSMNYTKHIVIPALLALTGCGTVRDAREAQKGEILIPGERIVSYSETILATNATATVAELEDIALAASPVVMQAREAVVTAQIAVRDAKAAYIPTIDASAGYTWKTSNVDPHNQSSHLDDTKSVGATLNMLVYDFGRSRAAKRQAAAALVAAERGARATENATRYNVRTACYALKRSIELREVATESAAIYAEHLRQMEDRYNVGAVNSYAVTKAKVDLSQSVLAAVTASNNVHVSRAALNLALGLDGAPEFEIEDGGIATYEGLGVTELMDIARTNSPALASLRASAEGASFYVDRTIADLYPSLGVSIQYTAGGESTPLLWNLVAGPSLSQSVFCAGRKRRAIEAAVSQLRIARSKVAAEELSLHNSITTAVLASVRASQQLDVARQNQQMAEENFDIVSKRYEVGKASELERSDAQVALSQAKASVVSAKYDYYDSQILISQLIGE